MSAGCVVDVVSAAMSQPPIVLSLALSLSPCHLGQPKSEHTYLPPVHKAARHTTRRRGKVLRASGGTGHATAAPTPSPPPAPPPAAATLPITRRGYKFDYSIFYL